MLMRKLLKSEERTITESSEKSIENVQNKFDIEKKFKSKCKNFKNWSEKEDSLLKRLFNVYGNKWKIIGKHFSNRTTYQLSYRIKTLEENDKKRDNKSKENSDESSAKEKKDNKFSEFLENSFFENLKNLQLALKTMKKKSSNSNSNGNFNANANQNKKNLNSENDINYSDLELNENFGEKFNYSQLKECLNHLGLLIRDTNYLSLLKKEEDKNKHFPLFLVNCIKSYKSIVEAMKKQL
jgi:hypothetical protein